MNKSTRVIRQPWRAWLLTARTAAAIAAATVIAACGSSSPSSAGLTSPNQAQAQRDILNFARCMRSHGVSNFPDDLDSQVRQSADQCLAEMARTSGDQDFHGIIRDARARVHTKRDARK